MTAYKTKILLNSITKIRDFSAITAKYDADFDIRSGRCVIDGKSIMGILTLDINSPHELLVNKIASENELHSIQSEISVYEVKNGKNMS